MEGPAEQQTNPCATVPPPPPPPPPPPVPANFLQPRGLPFVRPTTVPPPPPPPPVPAHFLQPRGLPFVRSTKVLPPTPPVPAHLLQPRDRPFVRPTTGPPTPPPVHAHFLQRRDYHIEPVILVFDDDEQVEPLSSGAVVSTYTEGWGDARYFSKETLDFDFDFAVHVHVKVPGMIHADAAPRAPLDLVTVLDVSESMSGQKLALLKQAMRFVINNLGPSDRLSVVSFSSKARRVTRLARMTDAGKASCVGDVNFLRAGGGANIAEGLRMAAKVLDERRQRNSVSRVLLLSDGLDTYTMVRGRDDYEALVPPCFLRTGAGGEWSAPIHTIGFGNDHDAAAMHVIAEATGGTFSFVENETVIQDAFRKCIGRLLSVAAQEARIAVACVHPGVRVVFVQSGRYESRVDEDGCAATVRVGELYAHEERSVLLFLAVPGAEESADTNSTAPAKVVFSYRGVASGLDVSVTADEPEVGRVRVFVEGAEDIEAARAAAERGAYKEAVKILENRLRAGEHLGWYGDWVAVALRTELLEMRLRKASAEQGRQQPDAGGQDAHKL